MKRTAHRPELLLSKNATGASLVVASVACGSNSIEQGALHRILREGPLDCRPRDRLQLTLLQAEALPRDGVLAADRSAEIGRVVRTQRELHTRFVKGPQWVGFVSGKPLCRDVGRRADLEHDAALGDRFDQRRVLD